jgi:hypothetical protein
MRGSGYIYDRMYVVTIQLLYNQYLKSMYICLCVYCKEKCGAVRADAAVR